MSGARFDDPQAPHDALLQARRGMAQCLRLLDGLDDTALDAQGRRALIAALSYDARDMAEALAALRRGLGPTPVPDRARRHAYGISLPPHALRYLFQHAGLHLDVEWRDLPGPLWDRPVDWRGGTVAHETPALRAVSLWAASLQLGGMARAVPAALADQVTAARVW
ncbi:hypothetical protein [Cognatishimia sp. F0-27]|uniref:hypothetical protein n=1 Tax=Cognatishimia sp. F0-27 TaxID=2816855 RepID=UPI001D0C1721|nr:hypothetical protein [Cognatishimia sp. F0-27]MCC1492104.1 hypothetical protein [Cognatishimia sp. F0-27]